MPRGGKRPGAGAPKGNTNALKTGARSRRFRATLDALQTLPQTAELTRKLISADARTRERTRECIVAMVRLNAGGKLNAEAIRLLNEVGDYYHGKIQFSNMPGNARSKPAPGHACCIHVPPPDDDDDDDWDFDPTDHDGTFKPFEFPQAKES